MSIELILLPVALPFLIASEIKRAAIGDKAPRSVDVSSRMKNEELLQKAFEAHGVKVRKKLGVWSGTWDGHFFSYHRNEQGLLVFSFPKDMDVEKAKSFIADIDQSYGYLVQRLLVARIQERVTLSGFSLESERVEQDHTVTMVLNLNRET